MKIESETRCFGGTQGFYTHDSICGPMRFAVYQPPQANEHPVPVITYLSGLTCTADNVVTKAGTQRILAELGLMMVCCDTSPREAGCPGENDHWDFGTGAGFYIDATTEPWSTHYRMNTYVTSELPNIIHKQFPTQGPHAESLMGHSMGGHGALTLGLQNPDRYRSLSALSPICAPTQCSWGQKAFSLYLGEDPTQWRLHDATQLVQQKTHAATILIDQGTSDSFLDAQLKPHLFEAACKKSKQPLKLRMQPGYDHSYFFISTFIEDHLRHHASYLI